MSPYDAELFGHWWFEGPQFLDFLFRKMHFDQDVVKPTTPSEYLERFPELEVCQPPMCTWGATGYAEVWLNASNDWIYPHLDMAAERMVELARRYEITSELEWRALNQAARELLLAQSSDWAFIMKTNTTVEYAKKRTRDHIARFDYLYRALTHQTMLEEPILARVRVARQRLPGDRLPGLSLGRGPPASEIVPRLTRGCIRRVSRLAYGGPHAATLRPAAVAGSWYPGTADAIAREVDRYLEAAAVAPLPGRLVALVSPHAGLRYSGPVAAYGYSLLRGRRALTVVLVGPVAPRRVRRRRRARPRRVGDAARPRADRRGRGGGGPRRREGRRVRRRPRCTARSTRSRCSCRSCSAWCRRCGSCRC